MEWQAYGDRGILLSQLRPGERAKLIGRFEQALPDGCREFVIGYDSLLLIGSVAELSEFADTLKIDRIGSALTSSVRGVQGTRDIPVRYDGPDLEAVATACGLTIPEVIQIHKEATYTVHMMGFAPGFPYLEGLDPRLLLARRESPRNHIRPGTVAIGGPHAGIYPVASPGGWHLLGQTDLLLFNPEAARQPNPDVASVFTLKPGDRVRFRAVDAQS